MKCEKLDRDTLIDDYLTGALSEEEKEGFEEHFFNCDVCFQELQVREEVVGLIKDEGDVLFVDYLEKRRKYAQKKSSWMFDKPQFSNWDWRLHWSYVTAVAGTIAFLAILIFKSIGPSDIEKYQPNFESLPHLEEMVTDVSRSYSMEVLSPKNGENFNGEIIFQWEPTEVSPLYLIILNNQGSELYDFPIENNQLRFTEKLPPGLYYWKLESEDDLLYVGKFFAGKPER